MKYNYIINMELCLQSASLFHPIFVVTYTQCSCVVFENQENRCVLQQNIPGQFKVETSSWISVFIDWLIVHLFINLFTYFFISIFLISYIFIFIILITFFHFWPLLRREIILQFSSLSWNSILPVSVTAWKVSVFGVFLVCIVLHLDLMRKFTL